MSGCHRGEEFIKYPRDNSWYILAKNVADFFPYPKNLPEVKLKGLVLMALSEEILRHHSINCVL